MAKDLVRARSLRRFMDEIAASTAAPAEFVGRLELMALMADWLDPLVSTQVGLAVNRVFPWQRLRSLTGRLAAGENHIAIGRPNRLRKRRRGQMSRAAASMETQNTNRPCAMNASS